MWQRTWKRLRYSMSSLPWHLLGRPPFGIAGPWSLWEMLKQWSLKVRNAWIDASYTVLWDVPMTGEGAGWCLCEAVLNCLKGFGNGQDSWGLKKASVFPILKADNKIEGNKIVPLMSGKVMEQIVLETISKMNKKVVVVVRMDLWKEKHAGQPDCLLQCWALDD